MANPTTIPTNTTGLPATPDWYKQQAGTGANTYAKAANALIPYLSPSDQMDVANTLGSQFSGAFKSYTNLQPSQYFSSNTPGAAPTFLSGARASQALNALNNMLKISGKPPSSLGAGYNYLANVLGNVAQLGGGPEGTMSRANYQQLLNQMSMLQGNLKSSMKSKAFKTLSPWMNLASMFATPGFSQGSIAPITVGRGGRTSYGAPNTRLFE